MYAIVEIAGKQYKVQANDKLFVPHQQAKVDETIEFDRVLLVADGDDVRDPARLAALGHEVYGTFAALDDGILPEVTSQDGLTNSAGVSHTWDIHQRYLDAVTAAMPLVVAISTTVGARSGLLVRDRRGRRRTDGTARTRSGRRAGPGGPVPVGLVRVPLSPAAGRCGPAEPGAAVFLDRTDRGVRR